MSDLSKYDALATIVPNVSRETFARLEAYEALFHKWSRTFNLTASSTTQSFWQRHILDSAQLYTIRKPRGTWVDIGSGGGLPGIVLAIFMNEDPNGCVHMIESTSKKAAFLRAALAETGASGIVHNIRVENAHDQIPNANVITARAVAPLCDLLRLAQPWMANGTHALFHKGRDYRQEIKLARDEWQFDLIDHKSAIDCESTILEIKSLTKLQQKVS